MIAFPNCKINLGLNIIRKRDDGYHDLETVFYPLPLCDILEVVEMSPSRRSVSLPFSTSGLPIEGAHASNLCVKAYRLLKKHFPNLPHIMMHIHKVIPSGAGLGGGSSDASFTLKLLNKMFNLKISDEDLVALSQELGSDCPFFILNKPCFAKGKGEQLEPLTVSLAGWKIVIVNPRIHVDTGLAFQQIAPVEPAQPLREIIDRPIQEWKYYLQNDFEKVIFPKHREIVDIKDGLYASGATYASMSGSGSTVFGIFPADAQPELSFPEHYFFQTLIGN